MKEKAEKVSLRSNFTKGLIKENPVLRLVLGTCPSLAVTTMAENAIGMGLAATFVLVCSNYVISLTRNVIPQKIRIPAYITIIAGFVTMIQMIIQAYFPSLYDSLGIFLPLITVNCIILARAEAFASKNKPLSSVVDGLGMGVGFTMALLAIGSIREILGSGTWFGISITSGLVDPMMIMILPPGGFFVFGILMAIANKLAEKNNKPKIEEMGCSGCTNVGCSARN